MNASKVFNAKMSWLEGQDEDMKAFVFAYSLRAFVYGVIVGEIIIIIFR